jgi:hypothetical protein
VVGRVWEQPQHHNQQQQHHQHHHQQHQQQQQQISQQQESVRQDVWGESDEDRASCRATFGWADWRKHRSVSVLGGLPFS